MTPILARLDGPAIAMLLTLGAIWGGAFIFVEIALTELPVLTLVAFRVVLAAAALWVLSALVGVPVPRGVSVWGALIVIGVTNNALPFSLIIYGQTEVTAGLAAIFMAATPLMTALLAAVLLHDERMTAAKAVGLLFGLAGVVTVIGPQALATLGSAIVPQMALLLGSFGYAISSIFGRRFRRLGVRPMQVAVGQTTGASLVLVPLALAVDGTAGLQMPSAPVVAAVLALALVSTALAYVLFFAVLSRAGATNATLVAILVPCFAIVMGVVFLGETIAPNQLAGMALIFAGFAVIDGRLTGRLLRTVRRSPVAPARRD